MQTNSLTPNYLIPLPCPVIFYWELSDPHSYPALHCLWPTWRGRVTLSPHPLPNPESSMFSTYYVAPQDQLIPLPCPVIFYWELPDPHSYHFPHCLGPTCQDRATLSPHPLLNLPILNVLQFISPAQWSFTESFQVLTPTPLYTLWPAWQDSYSLTPPLTQPPNPQCSQLTLLFFKVNYTIIQFLFPAQWSFTESFQILTRTPLYTVLGQLGKTELLSHPTTYPISQSAMFSTYNNLLQGHRLVSKWQKYCWRDVKP